jgi:hypothetical protein
MRLFSVNTSKCLKWYNRWVIPEYDSLSRAMARHRGRRRVRKQRLPPSQPILAVDTGKAEEEVSPPQDQQVQRHQEDKQDQGQGPTAERTSFIHLPVEIRLEIYRYALGDSTIVQPTLDNIPCWSRAPKEWATWEHIPRDPDRPSEGLHINLDYKGCPAEPFPHSSVWGFNGEHPPLTAIFGDGRPNSWIRPELSPKTRYTDLMRTCRAVYADILDVLYGQTTLCLFDTDTLKFFLGNASPEGLKRVRNVHIALVVDKHTWKKATWLINIEDSIRLIRNHFPSLRQLSVEIAALGYGQGPYGTYGQWQWLKKIFGVFYGRLDAFVLKVSCYNWLSEGYHPPRYKRTMTAPLATWDEAEYASLKDAIVCRSRLGSKAAYDAPSCHVLLDGMGCWSDPPQWRCVKYATAFHDRFDRPIPDTPTKPLFSLLREHTRRRREQRAVEKVRHITAATSFPIRKG